MKHPDCIIIGAGIIGLMSALELAQSGIQVLLIERETAGKESSWAGGGILSPLYPWRGPEILKELTDFSQSIYPQLATSLYQRTGTDPEWWQSGMVLFSIDDQESAEEWARNKEYRLESLDIHQLRDIEPSVAISNCIDAFHIPEISQIRNPRLISALLKNLKLLGVEILEKTEVKKINVKANKQLSIETRNKNYSSGITIICNGAWGSKLLPELEVRPVRGQMLCYQAPAGYLMHILLKNSIYIIPRRDGHILVGSTIEETGFDKRVTETARKQLSSAAEELLPGICEFPLAGHWSGLRPATRSGIPYICAHPDIQGLYLNTGHYRNGILFAPGSAKLLADLVCDREPIINPDPFLYESVTTAHPALI